MEYSRSGYTQPLSVVLKASKDFALHTRLCCKRAQQQEHATQSSASGCGTECPTKQMEQSSRATTVGETAGGRVLSGSVSPDKNENGSLPLWYLLRRHNVAEGSCTYLHISDTWKLGIFPLLLYSNSRCANSLTFDDRHARNHASS